MANPWFRLWTDMVNDPKWRTIARKSGQKIGDVIAVALHMMTCASNALERGHIEGWVDEDVATALDIETEQVAEIREAMQGRFLDGEYLTGWEKRQPKREREDDTAADRKRQQREREKQGKSHAEEEKVTPCHTTSHQKTPRGEESREEEKKQNPSSANAEASGSFAPRPLAAVCPHEQIIAAYHELLPMGTHVRVWNGTRAKHLQARWREDQKRQSLEWWRKFFGYVSQSEFLTGRAAPARDRDPFVVGLDWLVAPQNFAKVLEGRYHREAA